MVKVNSVAKAQKDQGKCQKCGSEILKGEPYRWWKPSRFTGKRVRCMKPSCAPAAWELESNEKRAGLLRAQMSVDDLVNAETCEAAQLCIADALEEVRAVIESFQEAVDSWSGTGLENSQRYFDFESAIGELEDWVQAAESVEADAGDCILDPGWVPDFTLDDVPEPDF
jgi:hypothetical protein